MSHPLEPLSANEVRQVVQLLRDDQRVTRTTRFISISLHEPDKKLVHAFSGAESIPRKAFVVLFDNAQNACYEVIVSITAGSIDSWRHIPGVQPTMTIDEQVECEQAVLASPLFVDAMRRHFGVEDTSLVMVDFWCVGNYGNEEERAGRLARPLCFLRHDPTDNGYARPIEGIRPVIDLNTMQVVRVEEYGEWALSAQRLQLLG